MKASEAKKLFEDYQSKSDITSILNKIAIMARGGKNIFSPSEITDGQRKALIELGYTIDDRNIIKW